MVSLKKVERARLNGLVKSANEYGGNILAANYSGQTYFLGLGRTLRTYGGRRFETQGYPDLVMGAEIAVERWLLHDPLSEVVMAAEKGLDRGFPYRPLIVPIGYMEKLASDKTIQKYLNTSVFEDVEEYRRFLGGVSVEIKQHVIQSSKTSEPVVAHLYLFSDGRIVQQIGDEIPDFQMQVELGQIREAERILKGVSLVGYTNHQTFNPIEISLPSKRITSLVGRNRSLVYGSEIHWYTHRENVMRLRRLTDSEMR